MHTCWIAFSSGLSVCRKDRPPHILPVTLLCRTSGAEKYIHTYMSTTMCISALDGVERQMWTHTAHGERMCTHAM